ncbi:MAG: hypothetical protein JW943_10440 [Deltaproteobacteria bacterium]|nr:hypothetical protein [Deltaproteobacteria bacterium]
MKKDLAVNAKQGAVDIQEEFIEPIKILIEDLRTFTDDGLSGDEQIDLELDRRIMMVKNYIMAMEGAINRNAGPLQDA